MAPLHGADDADCLVWTKGFGMEQVREAIRQGFDDFIALGVPAAVRAQVDFKCRPIASQHFLRTRSAAQACSFIVAKGEGFAHKLRGQRDGPLATRITRRMLGRAGGGPHATLGACSRWSLAAWCATLLWAVSFLVCVDGTVDWIMQVDGGHRGLGPSGAIVKAHGEEGFMRSFGREPGMAARRLAVLLPPPPPTGASARRAVRAATSNGVASGLRGVVRQAQAKCCEMAKLCASNDLFFVPEAHGSEANCLDWNLEIHELCFFGMSLSGAGGTVVVLRREWMGNAVSVVVVIDQGRVLGQRLQVVEEPTGCLVYAHLCYAFTERESHPGRRRHRHGCGVARLRIRRRWR